MKLTIKNIEYAKQSKFGDYTIQKLNFFRTNKILYDRTTIQNFEYDIIFADEYKNYISPFRVFHYTFCLRSAVLILEDLKHYRMEGTSISNKIIFDFVYKNDFKWRTFEEIQKQDSIQFAQRNLTEQPSKCYYLYILDIYEGRYIGITTNPKQRLEIHRKGTALHQPYPDLEYQTLLRLGQILYNEAEFIETIINLAFEHLFYDSPIGTIKGLTKDFVRKDVD